eukprot:m.200196 g.200196  ORF g.200196 m.200196 type:complete len:53 (-) comp25938_c0_seq3:1683-1841(-)
MVARAPPRTPSNDKNILLCSLRFFPSSSPPSLSPSLSHSLSLSLPSLSPFSI